MTGTFTEKRNGLKARVLLAMSPDEEAPTSLMTLVRATGATAGGVSATLHLLVQQGAVRKVGRGQYVRLVEEVRS